MTIQELAALKAASENGSHELGCAFRLSIVHINNVRGSKRREAARVEALANAAPCDCWLAKVNAVLERAGK